MHGSLVITVKLSLTMDDFSTVDPDPYPEYDPPGPFPYLHSEPMPWPMNTMDHRMPAAAHHGGNGPHDHNPNGAAISASMSQLSNPPHPSAFQNQHMNPSNVLMFGDWAAYSNPPNDQAFIHPARMAPQHFPGQFSQFHAQAMGFAPPNPALSNDVAMTSAPESAFIPYSTPIESYGPLSCYQHDLQHGLVDYPVNSNMQHHAPFGQPGLLSASPTDNGSTSGSETGWQMVEYPNAMSRQSFESSSDGSHQIMPGHAVSNPGLTLHTRNGSNSSHQEAPGSAHSVGSYDELQFPMASPRSEAVADFSPPQSLPLRAAGEQMDSGYVDVCHVNSQSSPDMRMSSSPSACSNSPPSPLHGSPGSRRKKDSTTTKSTAKPVFKKSGTAAKKEAVAKKIGRRKGPLRPDQRMQAGAIRRMRACIRCKFLKKTCDQGTPCLGCQPSHARLWTVPCVRVDIKDLGMFMRDWKADYDRHVTAEFSIANVKGYSPIERQMYVTHGFGHVMPISAREVYVRDENCFDVDWVETIHESPRSFDKKTAKLAPGISGVSTAMLSEYLDRHIDTGFMKFVDEHFEGTKFLTEMLKTAYRYYLRTQLPIVRKALKLVLAYNLTLHVTMVEGVPEEDGFEGTVDDEGSKYHGKTLAPVMINFSIKYALAMMWRDLQKDVLEELSTLFSSVYTGDKLKNWPTIFMLASILLAVWEEIQFDSHYRMADEDNVKKFCKEMEATPVGVIVGLFSAISTKLPAFSEWDTSKHHQLFNSDAAVCDALSEVREHVVKYGESFSIPQHG